MLGVPSLVLTVPVCTVHLVMLGLPYSLTVPSAVPSTYQSVVVVKVVVVKAVVLTS